MNLEMFMCVALDIKSLFVWLDMSITKKYLDWPEKLEVMSSISWEIIDTRAWLEQIGWLWWLPFSMLNHNSSCEFIGYILCASLSVCFDDILCSF